MYDIYKAMKDRMAKYLLAESFLTADALSGSNRMSVSDASVFDFQAIDGKFPGLLLMDKNTSGEKIAGGISGTEFVEIEKVLGNDIILKNNLSNNWTVSNLSKIKRAPTGVAFGAVYIGDLKVIQKYPAVCVVPDSETTEFTSFSSTSETMQIDFMVYVMDDNTEASEIHMLKAADAVKWILMSNFHIQPYGMTGPNQVTSKAMVPSVKYGHISKGSTFLKAARLSWSGRLDTWRNYLTAQGRMESPLFDKES